MDALSDETNFSGHPEKLVETCPARQFKQYICVLLLLQFKKGFGGRFSLKKIFTAQQKCSKYCTYVNVEKVRGEKLFNITNPQKSPFDDISQIPRVLFFISLLEMLAFAQMVEQKTLLEAIVVLILQREVYVCTYMRPLFEVTTRTQILVSSSSKYIDNLKQIFCGFQSIGFRMLHLILYDLSPLFGNTCVLCYSRIKVFMK